MCGIIGSQGQAQVPVDTRLHRLIHRGPDHLDTVQLNDVVLGHTRLAIVDVEHGQQPLKSPDGRYWLISNGEIYNHQEIRQQFTDYPFQTNSDSEVILALYQTYGAHAVNHLDGMFAFAIYDSQADSVFLARDPIGIKPLYYGWRDGVFYFASEIKSLHDIVEELHELPPSHIYHDGKLSQYFDLHQLKAIPQDVSQPSIAEIRASLEKAVQKRLMSDVPLGVYLSGGLDSTIVAALVAQHNPDVHSFAVGVEDSKDLENARQAAEVLGTQHHEYIYQVDEIIEALPTIIYYLESYDPSLVRSAIPNYFLARMTREYVTVVLTGEGADELYAGYHYLKQYEDDETLNAELIELTASLYNCNLQRCDRMTMAHSIEARVPFLDADFIKLSMLVPKHQKIHPTTQVEKWVLREAFRDILPENVLNRTKEQFSQGAGSNHLMTELAEQQFSDDAYQERVTEIQSRYGITITSKEMLLYFAEFEKVFSEKAISLVQLWRGQTVTPN